MGWTLSIDFGTTNTAAAYALEGQHPRPVRLTTAGDTIPSAVLAGPSGILVGPDAIRSMRVWPEAYLESPKLLIGQDAALLGDQEVPVVDLVAAVLGRVARKAAQFAGSEVPGEVALTHPHDWATPRKTALRKAWEATGIAAREVRLVSEPVAAATWLATETEVAEGAAIGVLDYGGGTYDVAVLRRTSSPGQPWQVLAHGGRADLGGGAIDMLLLQWGRDMLDRLGHHEVAAALDDPRHIAALRTLQDQVRMAKEQLSEYPDAAIPIEVEGKSAVLTITASEFDRLIEGEVEKATAITELVLRESGLSPDDVRALYLTGGSSHLLALYRALADMLGGRAATLGDPKLCVALGAHLAPRPASEARSRRPAPAPVAERRARVVAPKAAPKAAPKPRKAAPAKPRAAAAPAVPGPAAVADKGVFTRPPAATADQERVLDLLATLGCFRDPADQVVQRRMDHPSRVSKRRRPEGFPARLGSGARITSGWADLARLEAAGRAAAQGWLAKVETRIQGSNAAVWLFEGSATMPAYVALLPEHRLLSEWSGTPQVSPLVLTRDTVNFVRKQRNLKWLVKEIDGAVSGGRPDTTLEVQTHTGSRYLAQLRGTLELRLPDFEASLVMRTLT